METPPPSSPTSSFAEKKEDSSGGRCVTRARVAAVHKLGLDPDSPKGRTRILLVCATMALLLILGLSLTMFSTEEDAGDLGFQDAHAARSGGGDASVATFADDEEDLEGGDASSSSEDAEDEDSDSESSSSSFSKNKSPSRGGKAAIDIEGPSAKYKTTQLKLFQEKDASLLKLFAKHRKETEIQQHFSLLQDMYKELNLFKPTVIATTHERKSVLAYTLGRGKSGKSVIVLAGERANDWIGSMSLAYMATRLLQKYALTPAVTSVMESLYIHIVPSLNPDGAAYFASSSSKTHREWVMNRFPVDKKTHGVDLVLDYGGSATPQSETAGLKKFLREHVNDLFALANVKCCEGNVNWSPAASCPASTAAYRAQEEAVEAVAEAMGKFGGYKYGVGRADPGSDVTSFAFQDVGLGLSVTLQPRFSGQDKPTEILHAAQNVTMGLMELAKRVMEGEIVTRVGGGGGVKPCSGEGGGGGGGGRSEDAEDAEDEEDGDRSFSSGDAEDDEESSSGSFSSSTTTMTSEPDNRDYAASFGQAADGSRDASKSTLGELQISLQMAAPVSWTRTVLPDVPTNGDPSTAPGEYFLYFAFGPDMLYDVLLKAGIVSAWKVAPARLSGYIFDYTYHSNLKWRSGVADIVKSTHSSVYGVVWRIHKAEIAQLDRWAMSGSPTSPLARKIVQVQGLDGRTEFTALTYYVVRKTKGEDVAGKYHRFPPSRQYRNCVLKAARQHRLPFDYQEHRLKSRSLAPLFTDKIGTMNHRNLAIGEVCDP